MLFKKRLDLQTRPGLGLDEDKCPPQLLTVVDNFLQFLTIFDIS